MMHVRGGQSFAITATVVIEAIMLLLAATADSRLMKQVKPDPKDTVDDLGGSHFWNVVSFSDGLPNKGTAIPYFYLTTLDPTAKYALKDERASFTASKYPVGTCGKIDPENPTRAEITLTGKLKMLDGNSEEAELGLKALFSKHPEMKDWPKGHNFHVYKLVIERTSS